MVRFHPRPINKYDTRMTEKKTEECEKQKAEYLAGWQRARADFLNYKKEEIQRIGELVGFAQSEMFLKLLPILDDFEKAEKESTKVLEKHKCEQLDQSLKGFLQIKKQLENFLKNYGIEEIKTIGERFNPNFAEVVEEVEAKDRESGIIAEEIQKGYTLQGKVVRPAKVKVVK